LLDLPIREVLAKVVHQPAAANQSAAQPEFHEGDHILDGQCPRPLFEAVQFAGLKGAAEERANPNADGIIDALTSALSWKPGTVSGDNGRACFSFRSEGTYQET